MPTAQATRYVTLLFTLLLLCADRGAAQTVASHTGNNDPLGEGWNYTWNTGCCLWFMGSDAQAGEPGWRVKTPPGYQFFYHRALAASDTTQPAGWTATARARTIIAVSNPLNSTLVAVTDALGRQWQMLACDGSSLVANDGSVVGSYTAGIYARNEVGGIELIAPLDPSTRHRTYQMVYDPSADAITYYIDGQAVGTRHSSHALTDGATNCVLFGDPTGCCFVLTGPPLTNTASIPNFGYPYDWWLDAVVSISEVRLEIGQHPVDVDIDLDGIPAAAETLIGTDDFDRDSDDDWLTDAVEVALAAGSGCPNPILADSDGDSAKDGFEILQGFDPCDPRLDSDGDGLLDVEEEAYGTSKNDPDTDDDGLNDFTEIDMAEGSGCPSPLDPDSDDDGLADAAEVAAGTAPCDADSDDDGIPDGSDPAPLLPYSGGAAGYIADQLRLLRDYILAAPASSFIAPSANAAQGRRNALAAKANTAAQAVEHAGFAQALQQLQSLFERVDGYSYHQPYYPEDWMSTGMAEGVYVRVKTAALIYIVEFNL